MSTEYDPKLQALFIQAEQAFDHETFARAIMARIDRERRRTLLVWVSVGVLVIACLAVLAAPLMSALALASSLLPVELVEIENKWVQMLVSPVNSVAAPIAIGVLLLRKFYMRIFR